MLTIGACGFHGNKCFSNPCQDPAGMCGLVVVVEGGREVVVEESRLAVGVLAELRGAACR